MKKYVIIVAGGKGNRFESTIPKQFIELAGKPILMHTIEAFCKYQSSIGIIVVLPQNQIDLWNSLCYQFKFSINHQIVIGGEERFYSVKNGLKMISTEGLVAIHDGVRPLVDTDTIHRCFNKAETEGNAIPVIDLVDSIREVQSNMRSIRVDRNKFKLIQTPQVFRSNLIKEAFQQPFSTDFTDDASVFESVNPSSIQMVEGNRQNIKITTIEDLIFAEAIVKSRNQ